MTRQRKPHIVVDPADRGYTELLVAHHLFHPWMIPALERMAIRQPWSAGELLAEIEADEQELIRRRTTKQRRPLHFRPNDWKTRAREVPR